MLAGLTLNIKEIDYDKINKINKIRYQEAAFALLENKGSHF
jgi:hypothetical protein|tara:strand:+ start:288 stop:410 length:123 start_codon:yes stop_codon:yes gene_type:complete